jgi:hypothetical protein
LDLEDKVHSMMILRIISLCQSLLLKEW